MEFTNENQQKNASDWVRTSVERIMSPVPKPLGHRCKTTKKGYPFVVVNKIIIYNLRINNNTLCC